jgi:hypothetical protein
MRALCLIHAQSSRGSLVTDFFITIIAGALDDKMTTTQITKMKPSTPMVAGTSSLLCLARPHRCHRRSDPRPFACDEFLTERARRCRVGRRCRSHGCPATSDLSALWDHRATAMVLKPSRLKASPQPRICNLIIIPQRGLACDDGPVAAQPDTGADLDTRRQVPAVAAEGDK